MIAALTPPATLLEQTYNAILNAICQGSLAPGERLTQEDIAQRLSVSRQPVGQALALLRSQGFVKETGRRGLVVAHLDPAFFKAIYELRSAIEPVAARLAALRMTEKSTEEGKILIREGHRALRTGELHALVQADARFHAYIYELSGNPLFSEVMAHYWNHLRRAMGEVLQSRGEGKIVWRQHQAIFDALVARDAERAERMAEAHLESAVARVLAVVESHSKGPIRAATKRPIIREPGHA
ncbi:MAG TPA: GntR family transcriptional regulator [Casimicrobiaceae bacterium]|nr:GntR family transcriptional regulator [Casimicrobiaceae bacterium]